MFDPLITVLYVTPWVALLPVLVLWLGNGIESKVAIVFLDAVFGILPNVIAGMRTLDEQLVRSARVFGASDRQIFLTIALPTMLPFSDRRYEIGCGLGPCRGTAERMGRIYSRCRPHDVHRWRNFSDR